MVQSLEGGEVRFLITLLLICFCFYTVHSFDLNEGGPSPSLFDVSGASCAEQSRIGFSRERMSDQPKGLRAYVRSVG